jgi:nitroimidazol reductase NimA-like FMN-containing flavoprotein (pyridoxamine 5'-phosphate oxidase superfamily)
MSQGIVRRQDKMMSRADIDRFLQQTAFAHFATVSANGDPYVVPNLFIYADGKIFSHTSRAGHFRNNIEARPRVCFEAAEMGAVFPYGEFECDSSVSYTSVVGFGSVRMEEDQSARTLFFDRLMAKYSDPTLNRPKGFYPRLDDITLYALTIEAITGKHQPLPMVSEQWPTLNRTKSAGAVPPEKVPKG